MVGELDPRRIGEVRLGDADGQDEDAAAVLAVARFDDEDRAPGVLLHARPGPRAAVADCDPGTLGECGQVGLHLRARREVRAAVHELRLERLRRRLPREQAVPVVPLVRARTALDRGVRLRPRQEPLEVRPTPEHPARRRVLGDHRVVDPLLREGVSHLDAARAAADDHDGIRPRRKRPDGLPHQFAQLRNRWALWRRRVCACNIR